MESSLFEVQQQLMHSDMRREQFENENLNLKSRNDNITGTERDIHAMPVYLSACLCTYLSPSVCAAELKRLRADGEMAATQYERERQTLKQELINAQHEAQLSLRNALSDHQEELERLTNDKVSSCVVELKPRCFIIQK